MWCWITVFTNTSYATKVVLISTASTGTKNKSCVKIWQFLDLSSKDFKSTRVAYFPWRTSVNFLGKIMTHGSHFFLDRDIFLILMRRRRTCAAPKVRHNRARFKNTRIDIMRIKGCRTCFAHTIIEVKCVIRPSSWSA